MFSAIKARFSLLGPTFVRPVNPTPLPAPYAVAWNPMLAERLGLTTLDASAISLLAGNTTMPSYAPIAALYSGHQFGVYVQQLGDGRAITIAEIDTDHGIHEIQLKGAGATPFSRHADGRAVLRSTIREYLCSEAMFGLNIPTTRALAIVGSDEPIYREQVETAAVLTRVAPSHLRFGNFEVFYYRDQHDSLKQLADYVIDHFYPECRQAENPYQQLLEAVITKTARLMAQWQAVGFCHGVMNTDNMSILGLTIDYGPFGFLDAYNPHHICNHSDESGRYAYDQQPQVAQWNLYCLAQALIPLLEKEPAVAALEAYPSIFADAMGEQFKQKLGLLRWTDADWPLVLRLLDLMAQSSSDWTIFWRSLSRFNSTNHEANQWLSDQFIDRESFLVWAGDYAKRLQQELNSDVERAERMNLVNPKYILRNHLAEYAIRQARDFKDFSEIERLHRCLQNPFSEQPEFEAYAALPPSWAAEISVSCSS